MSAPVAAGEPAPAGKTRSTAPTPGSADTDDAATRVSSSDHEALDERVRRARELIAQAGRPLGRRALAERLGCTEHQARTVLSTLSSYGTASRGGPAHASTVTVEPRSRNGQHPEGNGPLPPDTGEGLGGEGEPGTPPTVVGPASAGPRVSSWPLLLLCAPAFVAIWSGWVGLGELAGFGPVRPLPGIADGFVVNTAITLPIGMEAYAAYAIRVWLAPDTPRRAQRFARASAFAALTLGALGQITFHLLQAAGAQAAPWPVTALVATLPVLVAGAGAGLMHLRRYPNQDDLDGR